jgi:heme o synthase
MPWLGFASVAYGFMAAALGAAMLTFAVRNRMSPKADRCAKQLFGFSILYLFLLFAEIAGERVLVF